MPIPQNLDLQASWKAFTNLPGSVQDAKLQYFKNTLLISSGSLADLEFAFWKSKSGLIGSYSLQDHRRATLAPYNGSELAWLRAQP